MNNTGYAYSNGNISINIISIMFTESVSYDMKYDFVGFCETNVLMGE